jgi:membrane protease YdiL (CAAX protease family)
MHPPSRSNETGLRAWLKKRRIDIRSPFISGIFGYDTKLMSFKIKGYWKETRKPVYSAALILPFLCIYHIGTVVLNTTYLNGADALIIRILSWLSVYSMFGSLLVLAAVFTIWQLRTRASWKISFRLLFFSFLESVCFALVLIFIFGWLSTHWSLFVAARGRSISRLVLYCGAGIYEELLFRGFLLGLLIALFNFVFHMKKTATSIAASIVGALLFAAFHYVGSSGDNFSIASFLQRTLAGLYFSALFVTRGFGITAASHAIYDIFVGLILG